MALTQSKMTAPAQLEQAIMLIDDVRNALKNEHPAIHQDLVEVRWLNTAELQPANGQKVIVRTQTSSLLARCAPYNPQNNIL